jgi:uncharacterized paraquat-inducible protein A
MQNLQTKKRVVDFPGHSANVYLCAGCHVVRVVNRNATCARCVPIVLEESRRQERKEKARRFWIAFAWVGAVILLLAVSGVFRGELPW